MDIENSLHIPHCYFLQEAISQVMPHTTATAFDCEFSVLYTVCFVCLCVFVVLCSIAFYFLETGKATVMWCVQFFLLSILRWYMYIWFVEVSWLIIYHINLRADEDEEGDRITVRGDEELQAMINGVGFKITSTSILIIIIVIIFKSSLGILAHVCLYKVGDLCKYMIPLHDGIIGIQTLYTDYR